MRPRSWTDDQFRWAADGATSMVEITRRLSLRQSGATNRVLRVHADRLGIVLPNGWHRTLLSKPIPTPLGNPKHLASIGDANQGREGG